jgi:hypothetical protein
VNIHSTVIEAHKVCRPFEERMVHGDSIRDLVTLPNRVAELFLNLGGECGFPPLEGICAAPLLIDDGAIRCESGYDHATGLWCTGVDVPPVAERPKLEDARESLRVVRSAFATFPFADAVRVTRESLVDLTKPPAVDEAAFLLGLMTAVCRPSSACVVGPRPPTLGIRNREGAAGACDC